MFDLYQPHDYIPIVFMPTTIHIPERLLSAVDRRARALGLSRNRLIVRALEREIQEASAWSPGFLDELRRIEPDTRDAIDEMLAAVRARRRSRKPPRL